MKKVKRGYSKMWTKEEIRELIKMWDNHTTDEMALKLGVTKQRVVSLAARMRTVGFKIPKKHAKGYLEHLLNEVLEEVK